ncbi:MAG: hypothetical protein M0037_08115 [Betaproteobacteria bacterium]|nr:hypothetical protein [Betaproteobacteria bacterium]
MVESLDHLKAVVQHNCDITDARHAQDYSMCIFLLKMRELFRWERAYPFSTALPKQELGAWLDEREQRWARLRKASYAALTVNGESYAALESSAINEALHPEGLLYGGGLGLGLVPHFFLAELLRVEDHDGYRVRVAGQEYARDLAAPPAMMQDGAICVRQESVRRMVWEKIEEWSWKKQGSAMARAMAHYDFDGDFAAALEAMTENETASVILHEVGECRAEEILGDSWRDMLAAVAGTRSEIMARAVRDHVADCTTTLPTLLAADNRAALHFYFANLTGMRRAIFPELSVAYAGWAQDGRGAPLKEAVHEGMVRWTRAGQQILDCYAAAPEEATRAIADLIPIAAEA